MNYIEIVEQAIAGLIGDATKARGEKEGQWNLSIGDFHVMVDVYNLSDNYYMQIVCPILNLEDVKDELKCKLYEEALSINDKLIQSSFSIYNGYLWLRSIRDMRGITVEEAKFAINILGQTALNYGKELRDMVSSN